jgi:pimeloyl-ACP methyl ester carboxylesterase
MTANPQTQHISVNGIKLAYDDWPGEHGPLVCIPSITGHKGTFSALAEQLSPNYRVLSLDLRGRCDSDKPSDGYGFAYHARDIIAFADVLQLEKFVLVGHSFGATASVYTTSLQPARIKALILLDGGADPKAETLKAMVPTVKRLNKSYSSMDEYLSVQRNVIYHKPWTGALERYLREDMGTSADGSVRSKSSAAAIEIDLDIHFWDNVWFYLPQLKCPVLYLRPTEGLLGATGHVHTEEEAAKLSGLIPDCRYEKVGSGNHYTFLIQDDPPVLPFITTFLQEIYTGVAAAKIV